MIRDCASVIDAVTYGVSVAGADGRAGMTAIVIDDDFKLSAFADYLAARSSPCACPLFLRIKPTLDTTDTFKQKKQQLMYERVDLALAGEPLYFWDAALGAYCSFDKAIFSEISAGTIRL